MWKAVSKCLGEARQTFKGARGGAEYVRQNVCWPGKFHVSRGWRQEHGFPLQTGLGDFTYYDQFMVFEHPAEV
jgi:hypothetical protein